MQNSDQLQPSSILIPLAGSRLDFPEEIRTRVMAGARLVRFEYCFSILLVTIRRQSPVFLTETWQSRYLRGLVYSLSSLLLGLWGIPWGPIWTAWSIWVNMTGGVDETEELMKEYAGTSLPEIVSDP
jgi:hypothetical protein